MEDEIARLKYELEQLKAAIAQLKADVASLQGIKIYNILLIEDSDTVARMFAKFWERQRHNVTVAKDGLEAIKLYAKNAYSIVFSDIQVPLLDGIEVTKRIRQMESESGRQRVPIVGVTGHSRKEYEEQARAAGMDEFITKPYKNAEILELAKKYLG